MSVVVETSEPFSEIEREIRKLERLLNRRRVGDSPRRHSTSREQAN